MICSTLDDIGRLVMGQVTQKAGLSYGMRSVSHSSMTVETLKIDTAFNKKAHETMLVVVVARANLHR